LAEKSRRVSGCGEKSIRRGKTPVLLIDLRLFDAFVLGPSVLQNKPREREKRLECEGPEKRKLCLPETKF
jgi:hypothetical protein